MSSRAMVQAIEGLELEPGDKIVLVLKVMPITQVQGGAPTWLNVSGVYRGLYSSPATTDGAVSAALRYDEHDAGSGKVIKRAIDVDMLLNIGKIGDVALHSLQ